MLRKGGFGYLSLPWAPGHRHRTHLWPTELCALQHETQREQHRWFYICSCPAFSNTCTLCLCHPVLLNDINLWHTDNLVQVSIYSATVSIQKLLFQNFLKRVQLPQALISQINVGIVQRIKNYAVGNNEGFWLTERFFIIQENFGDRCHFLLLWI